LRDRDFAHRLFARANLHGAAGAATPRQRWQRLQRGAGTAEMIDQRAERARADIGAADEAQPVDPLFVRQADIVFFVFSVAHLAPRRHRFLFSATSITEKQRERWARGVIAAPTPGEHCKQAAAQRQSGR
jgi:hypothetical protein